MVLPGPERTSSPEVACTGHHAPSCPTGPCREPSTATARSPARKSGRRPGAWWCGVSSVMIELDIPGVDELSGVVRILREWQDDSSPMQLHPGDLGWFWRFGAEATALAIRTWSRGDTSSPSGCWTVPTCCG